MHVAAAAVAVAVAVAVAAAVAAAVVVAVGLLLVVGALYSCFQPEQIKVLLCVNV